MGRWSTGLKTRAISKSPAGAETPSAILGDVGLGKRFARELYTVDCKRKMASYCITEKEPILKLAPVSLW